MRPPTMPRTINLAFDLWEGEHMAWKFATKTYGVVETDEALSGVLTLLNVEETLEL